VPLSSYAHFAAEDMLTRVVMERMLAGMATRTPAPPSQSVKRSAAQKSTSKSAISRRFVHQTETALAGLMARDLTELDIKVLMVDGEHMAERCVVVALATTADGTKVPVGLWDGSTENKTMVRSLLADLVDRGLRFDDGLLVVIDGAKALSAAVREVFGAKALIQRRQLHKRRNLGEHLPDKDRAWVDAKLVKAFNHPDPEQGLRNAKSLAAQLDKAYPSAAASLREGLDEMFTVARLGIDDRLPSVLYLNCCLSRAVVVQVLPRGDFRASWSGTEVAWPVSPAPCARTRTVRCRPVVGRAAPPRPRGRRGEGPARRAV
jgi:putative transposase